MKRLLILIPLLFTSSCVMALNQAQMRKKFPPTNASNGHMEFNTIYGVTGEMSAEKVTTTIGKDGRITQTFKGYSDKLTSPLGYIKTSFDRISFRNGVPVPDIEVDAEAPKP